MSLRALPLCLALGMAALPLVSAARAHAEPDVVAVSVSASTSAAVAHGVGTQVAASVCPKDGAGPVAPVEDDSIAGKLKAALASGNLLFALVLVLIGGFLTALSPCVYPLIPITLSILGARQAKTHLHGFLLAATYVSGMVILYSVLGVGFAAAGFLAGSALQSPVIPIGVALLCLVMSASMFGAFELALPSSLQTKLSQLGGGGFKGAFLMGLVAGIIAAPCTGPVLSFILTLIAKDGDIVKGAVLMVAYALGMGFPFLVLGTFSQAIARMPKSGQWMEVVKGIFGLMMIGAAVYYLRIGVPAFGEILGHMTTPVWVAIVLVAGGVIAGALHLSFKFGPPIHKARKGVGLVMTTAGLVAFVAWATGETAVASTKVPIAWHVVKNDPDAVQKFDALLADAKTNCKPVMIDFFAEWCIACKELDKYTYVTDDVRTEATRFTSIKVDATEESKALAEIQTRYGVVGLPTIVFIDGHGDTLPEPRVTGFVKAPEYVETMKRVR